MGQPTTSNKKRKSVYIKSPSETVREILRYAVIYLICIVYWEFLIYIRTQATLKGFTLWRVLFAIPISIFAAALNGWSKTSYKKNRLVTAVIALVFGIYYCADLIYFQSFGSLFSVSMMGMCGDAITNFWWSLSGTILKNIPRLILYLLPVIILFVYSFVPQLSFLKRVIPRRGFRPAFHVIAVGGAIVVWLLVVLILPIGGKTDASAYGAYHSKFVDTDTASKKLGALPNTLVELKISVFGSSDTGLDDNNAIDALGTETDMLDDTDSETDTDTEVSSAAETETSAEESAEQSSEEVLQQTVDKDGDNAYNDLDFSALAAKADDSDIQSICNYLDSVEPTNKNDYTGMFEGYNLIYICAESFSSYALNEKVTPNLCKLAGEGIVLNNYYNGFKNTTTNGEFALLTGIWPDVSRDDANMGSASGTMAQSATENMFTGLGNMFKQLGITPRAYHNYKGSYYSRNESWPNLGFECTFADTGLTISEGWPGSDLEMFQQSVDDYINDDQFCTYYMTFSGHGEYTEKNAMVQKNLDTVTQLLGSDADDLPEEDVNYLACNYELDQAIGYLLERLEETGKDKNTVIVLAADHYPYYLFTGSRNAFAGHQVDTNWEMYKSTCIMWNGGIESPIQVDTPCDNVDVLPTILNLFNIPYDSRLYAGVDIFSDATHVAQLYNKNFITDRVMYNAADEEATWLDENDTATDEEKQSYLDSLIDIVNKRYSVSIAIADTDFYNFVAQNIDIPTADLAQNATAVANANALAATAVSEKNGTAVDEASTVEEQEASTASATESAESDSTLEEQSEEATTKKGVGFFGILVRIVLILILLRVLLFVYVNRKHLRKKLNRYMKQHKGSSGRKQ